MFNRLGRSAGWAVLALLLFSGVADASTVSLGVDFSDGVWAPANGAQSYSYTYNAGSSGELQVSVSANSFGRGGHGQPVYYDAAITYNGGWLGVKDLVGSGDAAQIDDNTIRSGARVQESISVSFSKPVKLNNFYVGDFFSESNLFGDVTGWEAGRLVAFDAYGKELYNLGFNAGQVQPGDAGYLGPGQRLYDETTLGLNLDGISTIAFFADSDNMKPGWPRWMGGIGDESGYSLGGMDLSYDAGGTGTPEPASAALLLGALAGLGFMRRR